MLPGDRTSARADETIPVSALATLFRQSREKGEQLKGFVQMSDFHAGSNCCAVDGSRSANNGQAILANDIHLELGVPNLWYRAAICYEDVELMGVMIPVYRRSSSGRMRTSPGVSPVYPVIVWTWSG